MPKRPKHATLRTPAKPKRPTDPNRAAHAMIHEHMARLEPATPDFQAQLSAHMRKLGAKGGKIGGKSRMDKMTDADKSALALKAATERWSRERAKKKLNEK